jgi:dephospho-CoA kinase
MLIGLTGLYCAGKNYAQKILEEKGLPVLDVDIEGHLALNNSSSLVASTFGSECLYNDGTVNRSVLGAKVFGDDAKIAALENIVHPEANRLTEEWLREKSTTNKHLVINAALLHKSSAFTRLDAMLIVHAPYFVRFARARKRDGLSYTAIKQRLQSQKKFYTKYFQNNSDKYNIYTVENWGFFNIRNQLENALYRIGIT